LTASGGIPPGFFFVFTFWWMNTAQVFGFLTRLLLLLLRVSPAVDE